MMVNLTIETEGWDDFLKRLDPARIGQAERAIVAGLARLLLRHSMEDAPVRTGALRRAGFMQIEEGGQSAIVAFGVHYAGDVEGGTVAHEIDARNADVLAFIWPGASFSTLGAAQSALAGARATGTPRQTQFNQGAVVFAKHVFHPGTVPNPFMQRGLDDADPEFEGLLSEIGRRWAAGEDQDEEGSGV